MDEQAPQHDRCAYIVIKALSHIPYYLEDDHDKLNENIIRCGKLYLKAQLNLSNPTAEACIRRIADRKDHPMHAWALKSLREHASRGETNRDLYGHAVLKQCVQQAALCGIPTGE